MSNKKFIRKIVVALIVYCVILAAITMLFGFADVFVQNQIYLGQMQSSNEAYALLLAIDALRRHRNVLYFLVWGMFTGFVVREVHKHNKNVKGETNK